jgi:NTP pyrophosphatase (non-canonical NTP hydrolase)
MDMNEYQEKALSTAIYPEDMALPYCVMKLAGECGELSEKVAKAYRDERGYFSPERILAIKKEHGDILWYLANIAELLGFTMSDSAKVNITKLADRKARGVLHGDGDSR